MTNQDRRRAFDLRLAGYTWEEIGERLGYSQNAVERDLRLCITRPGMNLCRVAYPALQHYIAFHYQGSVSAFCRAIDYPRNKGGKLLRGELPMDKEFMDRVRGRTGLLTGEITRRDEHGTMAV